MCGNLAKNELLLNINKLHTTKLGADRIKNNLNLKNKDVIKYCREKILNKNCKIYKKGKNLYCELNDIIMTVNSFSFTIITAHKIKDKGNYKK